TKPITKQSISNDTNYDLKLNKKKIESSQKSSLINEQLNTDEYSSTQFQSTKCNEASSSSSSQSVNCAHSNVLPNVKTVRFEKNWSIREGSKYDIKYGGCELKAVVKFIGNKADCETQYKVLSSYEV
ncbi:unnamed protein product, partial [Brachionus calyciflorus]